ncbi:MAG TPA: hypothetical protein VF686_03360 [Brevundimonas sp.]|jgi:biotin transporter BioY
MNWLYAIMAPPWDYPEGWFAYLAVPILTSVSLNRLMPRHRLAAVVALSVAVSLFLYFALWTALYGVHSTTAIGVMFALVPYSVVCVLTVGIVRSAQAASPSA